MFPIHPPFIIDVIVHIVRVELTNSIVDSRLNSPGLRLGYFL